MGNSLEVDTGGVRAVARTVQAVGEEFEALSDGELYHGIDFGDSFLARAVESYGKNIEDRTYRLHNWCVRSSRALEDFAADVESAEEEIEYDFTYEVLGVS